MKRVLVLVVAAVAAFALAPVLILQDFTIYWKAANAFVHGLDPYDLPNHLRYLTGEYGGVEYSSESLKMWAPPTVFAVIFPLGWLSLASAKVVYLVLFTLTLVWSTFECMKIFSSGLQRGTNSIFQILLIFPIGWAIDALLWGGMNWISVFGLVLFLSFSRRNAQFSAGLCLFFFLLKPQQLAFVMLGILVWGAKEGSPRLFYGWAVAWVGAIIVTLLINPSPWQTFPTLSYTVPYRSQPFCSGLLHYLGFGSNPFALLVGWIVSGSIFLIWLLLRQQELKAVVCIGTALSILTCPYVWPHDFLVLAPFFAYLTSHAARGTLLHAGLIRWGLAFAQVTAIVGCIEEPNLPRFMLCIPVLVFLLLASLYDPVPSQLGEGN